MSEFIGKLYSSTNIEEAFYFDDCVVYTYTESFTM